MKTRVRITDHALVRYLERIKGVDISAIRQEMEIPFQSSRLESAAEQLRDSKYKVKSDGLVLVVSGNRVVTCYCK